MPRHPRVLEAVGWVIEAGKQANLPLVIDADGLWLITQRPELVRGCGEAGSNELVKGDHPSAEYHQLNRTLSLSIS